MMSTWKFCFSDGRFRPKVSRVVLLPEDTWRRAKKHLSIRCTKRCQCGKREEVDEDESEFPSGQCIQSFMAQWNIGVNGPNDSEDGIFGQTASDFL